MHLRFDILCNWRSYGLFGFELWYHVLLCFLVVFVVCVISRTMKWKLLESLTRFIAKSKTALLQYFFSNRNVSNAELYGWSAIQSHCLFMAMAHQKGQLFLGHIFLNSPPMHHLQLLQLMLSHPCHLLKQCLLVDLLMFLFLLSYLLMQHIFLDYCLTQPLCFHHMGNLVQMITCMSTFPQCQIWLSIWVIFLIQSQILICYLVLHLISWRNFMIIPRSFNSSELLNCFRLNVSLPLVVFFTMLHARFIAPLIRSVHCLLPSGIHWWNMKARRR